MITRYYLDESGNTGDLAKPGARFDFSQQEIFALACLGVDDEDELKREIDRLKLSHRIQAPELKSASVRDKPAFVRDLASYIGRKRLPLMIEVVDKRFMIAATMVNTLVVPPVGASDLSRKALWLSNLMAEYIHASAPSALFEAYVAGCEAPSTSSIARTFSIFLDWLRQRPTEDKIATGIHRFVADTHRDFQELGPNDEAGLRRFLPPFDLGKRKQSIWMLPNLSSLTNIYARLNRLLGRKVGEVTLIHDEQSHFDEILHDAKRTAEGLAQNNATPDLPFADYVFHEQATLVFVNSHASPGIQVADVLAGFVMRYTKDVLYGGESPSRETQETFGSIGRLSTPAQGTGINFVLTTSDLLKLGVLPA